MNLYLLVLRLVHIFAGIIWGGGALIMEFFISRSIAATGDSGKEFAQYLMARLRMHNFMTAMAISTVLAGALLYWHDSNGFTSAWMTSGPGIGFGVGALFGLIAFVFGAVFGNTNAKLAQVTAQIQGKPTNEQMAQVQTLQKQMRTVSPLHTYCMMISMIFMATARYLVL